MRSNPFKKRVYLFKYLLICLAIFILSPVFSSCSEDAQKSAHVKARLIPEVKSIQPGKPFFIALWLKMDEHWHTYWKNPGDSGLETKILWELPDGFVSGDIQWPYPKVFKESELVTFGYEGEVFLITRIEAPKAIKPGTNTKLSARAEWLACKDSCIAGQADLTIKMPVKAKNPKINRRWVNSFKETRKKLPEALTDWKMKASINESHIIIHINRSSEFKGELKSITFFPELGGIVNYSAPQNLIKSQDGYVLELQRSGLLIKPPERLKGVLLTPESWSNSRKVRALRIEVPLRNFNKKNI